MEIKGLPFIHKSLRRVSDTQTNETQRVCLTNKKKMKLSNSGLEDHYFNFKYLY